MPFDARAISNKVLDLTDELGFGISNLSLNKVIFFVHAHFLIDWDKKLVDQEFEAWKYGPVCADVFHSFKKFESKFITERARYINFATGETVIPNAVLSEEENIYFREITSFYARIPSGKLVDMSHVNGGPWDKTWNHDTLTNPGMVIPDRVIAEFFRTPWLSHGGIVGRA